MRPFVLLVVLSALLQFLAMQHSMAAKACKAPDTGCVACPGGKIACADPPRDGGGGPIVTEVPGIANRGETAVERAGANIKGSDLFGSKPPSISRFGVER